MLTDIKQWTDATEANSAIAKGASVVVDKNYLQPKIKLIGVT